MLRPDLAEWSAAQNPRLARGIVKLKINAFPLQFFSNSEMCTAAVFRGIGLPVEQ